MYILLNPPGRVRDPFGYGNKKKEEEGYLYPSEGRSKTVTDPLLAVDMEKNEAQNNPLCETYFKRLSHVHCTVG